MAKMKRPKTRQEILDIVLKDDEVREMVETDQGTLESYLKLIGDDEMYVHIPFKALLSWYTALITAAQSAPTDPIVQAQFIGSARLWNLIFKVCIDDGQLDAFFNLDDEQMGTFLDSLIRK